MIRGILKTVVIFVFCLVLGMVAFRLDEVWSLFKDFYTHFSWEMILTVLFTGASTGIKFIYEWASWEKDRTEKKKQKWQ